MGLARRAIRRAPALRRRTAGVGSIHEPLSIMRRLVYRSDPVVPPARFAGRAADARRRKPMELLISAAS